MEDSFEDTQAMKGAKAYILKEKFASFKMKEYEKKKSVAFKARSSKGKAKQDTSSEDDGSWMMMIMRRWISLSRDLASS